MKAFTLTFVVVTTALLISCVVIMARSPSNKNESSSYSQPVSAVDPEEAPVNPDSSPARPLQTQTSTPSAPPQTQTLTSARPESNTVTPSTIAPTALKPALESGALVFVIDDAGNNLRELEPFLRIPYPLTIAVLPGLPYSAEAAGRIRAAGKEVILHQPMEALGAQNPGPGAIYSHMSADEIREVLARNIEEVGPVAGVNNHQGSKITIDAEAMKVILDFCSERGVYFLDSRTTAETAAPEIARQTGTKFAERNIFIDNEQNKNSMLGYIAGGLDRARRYGSAVMIGHAWSPDLAPLLFEQIPVYIEQGYIIKTVSGILKD